MRIEVDYERNVETLPDAAKSDSEFTARTQFVESSDMFELSVLRLFRNYYHLAVQFLLGVLKDFESFKKIFNIFSNKN